MGFKQFVKGAKPKFAWQKRQDFTYERKKTIIKIEDMPRLKSPSPFEDGSKPMYQIDFHARRSSDSKQPLISSMQSISGAQLGEVIATLILDLHVKLCYDPCALAHSINKAVVEAWNNRIEEIVKEAQKAK